MDSSSVNKSILIGYAFSKTGGTSLVKHAKDHLGAHEFHTYGKATNDRRLAAGELLVTDWEPERRDYLRFLTGHAITREIVDLFSHRPVFLFTVVRDPWARFVSVYKHRHRMKRPIEPRALFAEQARNPFATEILRRFGGSDVFQMLDRFSLVMATERLDIQSSLLFKNLGLPPPSERARVYPEVPDMGDMTREEVYERDALDLEINRMAAKDHWVTGARDRQEYLVSSCFAGR